MTNFLAHWFNSSWSYLVAILPWLVVGILISFLLKKVMKQNLVRVLLGKNNFSTIILAEIVGAFSPVSIIALLPLASTLLEEGANPATMAAFLLAARAYNPEALPASLSLLGLEITVINLVITFVAVTACALFIKQSNFKIEKVSDEKEKNFFWETLKFTFYVIVGVLVAGLIVNIFSPGLVARLGGSSLLALPVVITFGFLIYLGFVGYFPIAKSFLDLGLSKASVITFISSASIVNLTFLLMFTPIIGKKRTLQVFGIYLFVIVVSGIILHFLKL